MDSPALQLYYGDVRVVGELPTRGVGWVLRWAAAYAVFVVTLALIAAFALQLSAEADLRRAAAAGLREAALPRATYESVVAVVRRQLAARPRLMRGFQLQLAADGASIRGLIPANSASQLSLTLTVPASNALPRLLAPFVGDSTIRVQAGAHESAVTSPTARFAAPLSP
jgi:hypothetical protein